MVFDEYARYYDLLYQDKDYQAEADYVAGLIHRFNPGAQSILELGSGTGRHARLLAEKGFRVHGIERSPAMLARARELLRDAQVDPTILCPFFSQGDIRTVCLPDRFDAVIALFHVISYQVTNEDVIAAFHTARKHLKPGGIFIFDIWYGPAVLSELPTVKIKRMADKRIGITRLAEPELWPNENRVDVHYHVFVRNIETNEVRELKETHPMRYFFLPELQLIIAQTGFNVENVEEWHTGSPIGLSSWSACFCLTKI